MQMIRVCEDESSFAAEPEDEEPGEYRRARMV
jgi:hypothetical protein